jgi:hypothetical protein
MVKQPNKTYKRNYCDELLEKKRIKKIQYVYVLNYLIIKKLDLKKQARYMGLHNLAYIGLLKEATHVGLPA